MLPSDPLTLTYPYFATPLALQIVAFALYVVLGCLVMRLQNGRLKDVSFLLLNLFALDVLYWFQLIGQNFLLSYLFLLLVFYVAMRLSASSRFWWMAAVVPIIVLISTRFLPSSDFGPARGWIGLCYMVFRIVQLVVLVRNDAVKMPGLMQFFSFVCFLPTFVIGPISSYGTYHASYLSPNREITPYANCLLRVIVGMCKVVLLGCVLDQLSYRGLLLDGHPHGVLDLLIAAVAYYGYLYCNFSGFCDVVIGGSGLMGIKVTENFNEPMKSRNLRDFWNRWHITLSNFMRDMVFTPLAKFLLEKLPKTLHEHALVLPTVAVFMMIGLWHGSEMHYLLFGLAHAFGMVAHYYYGLILKRSLTKEQLRKYNSNKLIQAMAVFLTFAYVTATFFLFANDDAQIKVICEAMLWNNFF